MSYLGDDHPSHDLRISIDPAGVPLARWTESIAKVSAGRILGFRLLVSLSARCHAAP